MIPAHEALLVREGLREASREIHADQDDRFQRWISEAATTAESLEVALRKGDKHAADRQFRSLEKRCKDCHAVYRN